MNPIEAGQYLEAYALTKLFGKHTAMDNLKFQIAQGELFGI